MRPTKQPLLRLAAPNFRLALMTLCIAIGCVYPLSLALELAVSKTYCLLCCGGVALLFFALDCVPRLRVLAYPIAFVAILALAARCVQHVSAISAALTLLFNGQPLALVPYSRTLVLLFSLIFGGMGAGLANSEHAFGPLALWCGAMLLVITFVGSGVSALTLLPLLLATLLSAGARGVSIGRILPSAALILLLCLPLAALGNQTIPQLREIAQQVRQMLEDYLFFTDPRTTFSLSTTGWQPLGADRLGGPVSPTDEAVMQVRVSDRALLRGTIKNEYTGLAWRDSTSGRRYLLVNPRFATLRRNLFDQRRPEDSIREQAFPEETLSVLLRADAASTLYLTQRFSSLTGAGIVPYFSPASEVFGTRSLAAGDSYTFTGSLTTASTPGVRELVLAAAGADDPYLDTVLETYTAFPSSVGAEVIALAKRIASQAETDFDRASALCNYLQSAYPYSLDQNVPPADRDFVSWFLLTEQRGYCTSFASALAVMARAIGLPARYIEGYAASPDSDGVARVTQQDAHAWVEIYFAGFGWLSFDPTPGARPAQQGGGDSDAPDDPDNPDTPTPSPSPTPSPEPTPTPTPSPSPENDDPDATPTPTPSPSPQITPSPTPSPTPPPDEPPQRKPPILLLAFLLLLLLIALIALRLMMTAPARIAAKQSGPADALLVWYRAIEALLGCMGLSALLGEAPATYLARAQKQLGEQPALAPLGRALYAARYSGKRIKPVAVTRAERIYGELVRKATLRQKLRFTLHRLLHGIKI